MYTDSAVQVTSSELEALKDEIVSLSENLKEIFEVVDNGMKLLNEDWKDDKYIEFEQEFKPRMDEIDEIGGRYYEWATKVLPPKIELLRKVETARMGIG